MAEEILLDQDEYEDIECHMREILEKLAPRKWTDEEVRDYLRDLILDIQEDEGTEIKILP